MSFRHWVHTRWGEWFFGAIGALVLGFTAAAGSAKTPTPLPSHRESSVRLAVTNTGEDSFFLRRPRAYKPLERLAPRDPIPRRIQIDWGQTLWGISRQFHLTVKELEEANHLTPESIILAGTTLIIPTIYRVKAGDTLNSVAERLGVNPGQLLAENELTGANLTPGEALVIPFPQSVSPPSLSSRGAWPNPYNLSPEAILMIARLVQAESGDQPFEARVAVAAVVLNRLKSPGFPKTVDGVLFAPGQFQTVATGAFWNNPTPLSLLAAKAAASGWDPTGGALYFYNPSLPHVAWMDTLPQAAVIGAQIFSR